MVRIIVFVFLLSGVSILVNAQNKVAKGRIIDAESKQAIPYVNIGVLQKNIGTVTSESGQFQLSFPGNMAPRDSIVFRTLDIGRLPIPWTTCLDLSEIFNYPQPPIYFKMSSLSLKNGKIRFWDEVVKGWV